MSNLKTIYLEHVKRSLMDVSNRDVAETIIDPRSFEEGTQPEWFEHFWFGNALTMCGMKKLNSVQFCVETSLSEGIPGDFIECGVWRGGVSILMRAILAAHGCTDRTVWVADSFEGLPTPPPDSQDAVMHSFPAVVQADHYAVHIDAVKVNFQRYGLLDEQVQFLKGWFADTLPTAPVQQIAVLRVDGDYYESTMDVMNTLYDKVAPGGFIILDDWGLPICGERQAIIEYREAHGINEPIVEVDWQSAYWRKKA